MFFHFVTIVVMLTSSFRHCQKAIKKLNNIIIAYLITNRRLNILSNIWRFNISVDKKMLGKEFET